MSDKPGFLLYGEYEEQIALLSDEEVGQLLRAIFAYENRGEIIKLSPLPALLFVGIRQRLDKNTEIYNETRERNKEYGKKGGRPSTTQNNPPFISDTQKTQLNQTEPKLNRTEQNQTEKEKTKTLGDSPQKDADEPPCVCQIFHQNFSETKADDAELVPSTPPLREDPPLSATPRLSYAAEGLFESLWAEYPRKEHKSKVSKKDIADIIKAGYNTVLHAINEYKRHIVHDRIEPRYIMHGGTFFSGGRWREFLPTAKTGGVIKNLPIPPPGWTLEDYCRNPNGTIDGQKLYRTKRALEGDEVYAKYMPEF